MLLASQISLAGDKACLMEGKLEIGIMSIEIKDCLQNEGVEDETFQSTCQQISEVGSQLGAPPETTYLQVCPDGYQGICKGFLGQPINSYYYKRDDDSLVKTKESCLKQGGQWES